MTLLNRLVLSIFTRFTCLALISFSSIYLLIDFFEKVDGFLKYNAGLGLYFLYFLNKTPVILSQLMPFAILMGAFMTLATLARHGELAAMFSSGISLFSITRPILLAAFLVSLGTLVFNEFLLPLHVQKSNQILRRDVQGKEDLNLKLTGVWFREGNSIVNILTAEPKNKTLIGVSVYQVTKDFNLVSSLETKKAVFQNGQWVGESVRLRRFDSLTGGLVGVKTMQEQSLGFSKDPEEFKDIAAKREEKNFRELWILARQLKREGYDAASYEVDMHSRLSTPFACSIMAFLGIPFALRGSRRAGMNLGVVVSAGVGIFYYFINALLMAFGYSSVLPPLVAAWGANVLFFLLGIYLLLSQQN